MLTYAAPGIAAAVLLGLGRAFGEAIAVNQTIGNANLIPSSWFQPGDSLGSKIASEYVGATSVLQARSILYLAAILMVISLVTNVIAQVIVVRFERARRACERRAVERRPVRHHRSLERAAPPPGRREGLRRAGVPLGVARLRDPRDRARDAGLQGVQPAQPRFLHGAPPSSARRAASRTRSSAARSSSGWRW